MPLSLLTSGALAALVAPALAFFRLPCQNPVVVQRADPIVSPGALSSHVHTIMGGNGFGFEMNYKSTQASTCSSCIVTQDMSNYWVPTLYYRAKNGSFISVGQNGGVLVYYLQRADSRDPLASEGIHAFPEGFSMIAGDSTLRNYTDTLEQRAISYSCLGVNGPETPYFPKTKCPDGVRSQVFFPSCWDGVKFEPKDQKKHLAYPSNMDTGYCSPPFNKRLVSLFYEVVWNTPDFDNDWYGKEQPFVWSNGDPTGYGYHGDFVNGWNVPVLQKAINDCTADSGVIQDCKHFTFFNNDQTGGCKIPVSVHEQTQGVLPALPGCNTVQKGPGKATPNKPCGAPTRAGAPILPYTDVRSRGWRYLGCGLDIAGRPRTLLGDELDDSTGMTVERCVDHCKAKGYSIAGVEYSKQCFCGNKFHPDRAPDPKRMGSCNMPCTGNPSQTCGGAGLISLYHKCEAGKCNNAAVPFINGSYTGSSSSGAKRVVLPSGNSGAKSQVGGRNLHDAGFEQTAVATHNVERRRTHEHLEKHKRGLN